MSEPTPSRRAFAVAALAAAVAGILAVYSGQIDTGLYYDDYHFVRPLRPLDWRRVWFGSWDPTGVESPFFRPITAWLYGFRFWLFGLNTLALHALSLAGHGACAVLAGWFLRREGVRPGVALFGAWLYAIHPVFPYAQASWATNQMHLAVSLLVLATLHIWQTVRDRSWRWWLLLPTTAVPAFLIKEDALMLLPVLVTLTAARAWLLGEFRWSRIAAVAGGMMAVAGALIALRQQRLGRIGGYGIPDLTQANLNFWKGLLASLLLWPTRTPWQGVSAAITIGATVATLWLARRSLTRGLAVAAAALIALLAVKLPTLLYEISYPLITLQGVASGIVLSTSFIGLGAAIVLRARRSILVISAGVAIALLFDLPYLLVSKREQYHLLGLGAVLVLAGAVDALVEASNRRRVALAAAVLISVPVAALTRTQTESFRPCAENVLQVDGEAAGWWVVPDELEQFIHDKRAICEQGREPRIGDLPLVTWGAYPQDATPGEPFRWTTDHVVMLVHPDRSSLPLAIRRPDATAAAPVTVRLAAGRQAMTVALDSGEWKYVTVPLTRTLLTRMRSGHLVTIDVDGWFVPALRDPASQDIRRYGVQLRVIELGLRRTR